MCTGNICRSPMAEALLRARAEAHHLHLQVSSAGSLFDGRPAEPGAVSALASRGVDLSDHRSRVYTPEMVGRADLVIGMEQAHVREVSVLPGASFWRTYTFPDLVQRAEQAGPRRDEPFDVWLALLGAERSPSDLWADRADLEVADPMGAPARVFGRSATEIADLVDRFVTVAWPDDATDDHQALDRHPTPRSV